MRILFVLLILGSVFAFSSANEPGQLNLMPMPASVQTKTGQLVIDPTFSVGVGGSSDELVQRAVARFLGNLRRQTGMSLLDMKITNAAQAKLVVQPGASGDRDGGGRSSRW